MKLNDTLKYQWNLIETYEKNEIAVVWHMGKFFMKTPPGATCHMPAMRMVRGDEVLILKGFDELKHEMPDPKNGPGSICYPVRFRGVEGIMGSACLRHKDESKNVGTYMHAQQGWTI